MITIKDVAKAAQVSVATVSRVLNHDKNVSPKTRERVTKVIEEMEYTPNILGRNLRRKNTGRILVVMPSLSNQFLSGVIRGMETEAAKRGLQVIISATHNDREIERGYLEMLPNRSVDGIILLGSVLPMEELAEQGREYPLVMCSEWSEGTPLSAVGIDNRKAGFDAVMALTERKRYRIAIISNEEVYSARLRTEGYCQALRQRGIEIRKEYIINRYEYTYRAGMYACRHLMELPQPPDAIFAVSDELAAGVEKELLSRGIVPGQEVDVFGFDNTTMSQIVTPTISTVSQPRKKIGATAVNLLAEKMENLASPSRMVLLPHELVLRESTGKRKES